LRNKKKLSLLIISGYYKILLCFSPEKPGTDQKENEGEEVFGISNENAT